MKNPGSKRQILNIINFIRGVEPREDIDLLKPVRNQISLMKKYNFKGTFLLQYDALTDPAFTNMLKFLDPGQFEIGVWLEIVQPLAEKAGIKWRGRFSWDWHAHCGFSVGYSREERERLIDVLFEDFKACFGYYPKSLGSWAFDAHSLAYAHEKYGLDAACNCKDQWGTDGYNLWGGYYGQGYYPSIYNSFAPAQTREKQIQVPVFRMLGSDPIHQYDSGLDIQRQEGGLGIQGVFTLEPVYKTEAGGGIPAWVDWYLSQNYNGNCLTFAYAQAGQENSFGWEKMKDGLEYQFKKFADMAESGKLELETLGETGRWYKKNFSLTPASTITALEDWSPMERKSIWYNCRNYRANLYAEKGRAWIRDIYLFREDYRERYLDYICTGSSLYYDNLPFVDGNRFSGHGIRGGLYPMAGGKDGEQPGLPYREIIYKEEEGDAVVTLTGTPCGDVTFSFSDSGIHIRKNGNQLLCLQYMYDPKAPGLPQIEQITDKRMDLSYRDCRYYIEIEKGRFAGMNTIHFEKDELFLMLDRYK